MRAGDAPPPVRRLDDARAPEVVAVLCDAFRDYPVMRYVLGPGPDPRGERLAALVRLFVMARVLRGEPVFGIEDDAGLLAVAIISDPHGPPSPDAFLRLREETWATLGADARARYDACTVAWSRVTLDGPNVHLNMLGVRRALQGRGLAARLLGHVHRVASETPRAEGVTLATELPANVALYRRFGYEVVGQARVDDGLETWSMFRPRQAGAP